MARRCQSSHGMLINADHSAVSAWNSVRLDVLTAVLFFCKRHKPLAIVPMPLGLKLARCKLISCCGAGSHSILAEWFALLLRFDNGLCLKRRPHLHGFCHYGKKRGLLLGLLHSLFLQQGSTKGSKDITLQFAVAFGIFVGMQLSWISQYKATGVGNYIFSHCLAVIPSCTVNQNNASLLIAVIYTVGDSTRKHHSLHTLSAKVRNVVKVIQFRWSKRSLYIHSNRCDKGVKHHLQRKFPEGRGLQLIVL